MVNKLEINSEKADFVMYGNTLYFASARNVGGKHTVRTMSHFRYLSIYV
jgi:hypothetical protein